MPLLAPAFKPFATAFGSQQICNLVSVSVVGEVNGTVVHPAALGATHEPLAIALLQQIC